MRSSKPASATVSLSETLSEKQINKQTRNMGSRKSARALVAQPLNPAHPRRQICKIEVSLVYTVSASPLGCEILSKGKEIK